MTTSIRRKYINEWTIVITVTPLVVGRQQDLRRTGVPETEDACNLYFESHRPRMSINPSSVTIHDGRVNALLQLQYGDSWSEFELDTPHSLGPGPLYYRSEWPYDEFAILDSNEKKLSGGVVANLHAWVPEWPDVGLQHDIVYIGQAFGQSGERTAWDRLKRHETVQRVLSETSPDRQVWLSLAAITDIQLISEIDPRYPTSKSRKEDDEHDSKIMDAVQEGSFRDKQAVALAEAGLIRFFQPKYNDRMKYRFPSRRSVPLESIRELDLHGLIVEFNGESVNGLYGSPTQDPSWLHFAGFAIHQESGRKNTLTLESTDWYPGKAIYPSS